MLNKKDLQIFPKVQKSLDNLNEAVTLFEHYLREDVAAAPGDYYRARNLLKQGDSFFQEALKNAKKLLGPLPDYATEEFQKWRQEFLENYHILALCQELEACSLEMHQDEFLNQILEGEEIDALLNLHYHSQQEGNRKLAHIKVRIVLDKLSELLIHAKELQKQVSIKQQQAL